jgi:hypothetical protein
MVLNLFPQDVLNEDPFLGVWFIEFEGDKIVHIYKDGIITRINPDMEEINFEYKISGDLLIINNGEEEFEFILVDKGRIILKNEDISALLVKQDDIDIKQKIENFLK